MICNKNKMTHKISVRGDLKMNKMLFAFVALIATATAPAHAERFILKNPTGAFVGKTVQTMTFGNDTYVVVEAPRFANLLGSVQSAAESVTEDRKIGIPTNEFEFDFNNAGRRAWHVDSLNYAKLPVNRSGEKVIVAVLDTGVDYNHTHLKNSMYTNSREVAGNGIDDDNNGYIDDVHGYDFDSKDGDPMDEDQHGTHCAGIIGSSEDSVTGARGVAPGVKVMAVRIIGNDASGFMSNAVAGIKYAVDNGAKVLSNSWRVYKSWGAFDPSDANIAMLRAAIEYAESKGAVFVAASGNETLDMDADFNQDPLYPAGFTGIANMVVVAASASNGNMAYFSNFGANYVTVAAPGDNIVSTVPGGTFMSMSGTSMAAPLVAGSIARGLSANMTSREAVRRLESTSAKATQWTTRVRSGGVIDLMKYLE